MSGMGLRNARPGAASCCDGLQVDPRVSVPKEGREGRDVREHVRSNCVRHVALQNGARQNEELRFDGRGIDAGRQRVNRGALPRDVRPGRTTISWNK